MQRIANAYTLQEATFAIIHFSDTTSNVVEGNENGNRHAGVYQSLKDHQYVFLGNLSDHAETTLFADSVKSDNKNMSGTS